jgi:Zn-dependent peptidase ImmA (M78 family)
MKKCSIVVDNTPIYQKDMDEGVMGQANKNGSIVLNKNLSPLEQKDVIRHEKVHLNQMERGDLDYDNDNVYWKGKKIPRSTMDEGNKKLPWEREAYKKQ